MLFRIGIVGPPNVGKSSLFNRLVGRREAIISEKPGVTRDLKESVIEWDGFRLSIVDSGGYLEKSDDPFSPFIRERVRYLISHCDLLFFVVYGKQGISPAEEEFAQILHQLSEKPPVLLVVNKCDNPQLDLHAYDFSSLGFEPIFPISALHNRGIEALMHYVITHYRHRLGPKEDATSEKSPIPRFTIVGRPNTGKSTFINVLFEQDLQIVTPIPGTTRDSNLFYFNKFGFQCYLIDTAGIRKKAKIKEDIEFFSVLRSKDAIQQADVVILFIDATSGVTHQDLTLYQEIEEAYKPMVIGFTKWDLVEEPHTHFQFLRQQLITRLGSHFHYPILTISSVQKKRLLQVLKKAFHLYQEARKEIPTRQLNDELLPLFKEKPHPTFHGHRIKFKFIEQVKTAPPTFLFFTNYPNHVKAHYLRFIENTLRKRYHYEGIPIRILLQQSPRG